MTEMAWSDSRLKNEMGESDCHWMTPTRGNSHPSQQGIYLVVGSESLSWLVIDFCFCLCSPTEGEEEEEEED